MRGKKMRTGWRRPSRRDDVSRENTEASTLNDEQRLDWLCLIRSEHVGPRTFRALLNRYGSAQRARCAARAGAARRSARSFAHLFERKCQARAGRNEGAGVEPYRHGGSNLSRTLAND